MRTALFHNFTTEAFTGYWDGKAKTFKPGAKVYMPEYLASHYAKHLANRELMKKPGGENYTSPKKPEQVPAFMELFKQACIVEAEEQDEAELQTDLANKVRQAEPSMDIPPQPAKAAHDAQEPQIVEVPGDDDEEFEAPAA